MAAVADYWHTWVDSWIDDPTIVAGAKDGALRSVPFPTTR